MRVVTLIAALLLFASAGAIGEGKITADPNAAPRVENTQATDPKLAQKVSLEAKDQRLHSVLAGLSEATGATVACGSGKSDWRVRDIPVTICVKDMPLGELLDLVAKSTHTSFRSTLLESKGGSAWTHRFYRSKHDSDEIAAWMDGKRIAELSLVRWQWEALVRLGSLSDTEAMAACEKHKLTDTARPLGRLLAELGPNARDRVLTGEALTVSTEDARQADLLRAWCETQERRLQAGVIRTGGAYPQGDSGLDLAPPPAQASTAGRIEASFQLIGLDGTSPISLQAKTTVSSADASAHSSVCSEPLAADAASLSGAAELGIPPRPDKAQFEQPNETLAKGFRPLLFSQNSDPPALSRKVRVELPKDIKDPTAADKIAAIGKAAGITIICEDFESHRGPYRFASGGMMTGSFSIGLGGGSGDAGTILSAIRKLDGFQWFTDDDGTTLVGWARNWRASHTNLVPESLIADLTAKLKGDGVELDDVVSLLDLTQAQRQDWIYGSRYLVAMSAPRFVGADVAAWRLYGRLSAQDKALAHSKDGLPLAKLDPQWIAELAAQERMRAVDRFTVSIMPARPNPLTDPERIREMVMHVTRTEYSRPGCTGPANPLAQPTDAASPQKEDKRKFYSYSMNLVNSQDSSARVENAGGPACALPIFEDSATGLPVLPSFVPEGQIMGGSIVTTPAASQ